MVKRRGREKKGQKRGEGDTEKKGMGIRDTTESGKTRNTENTTKKGKKEERKKRRENMGESRKDARKTANKNSQLRHLMFLFRLFLIVRK